MREWLSSLAGERVPEVALALALGYALVGLTDSVVHIPVSALAQHFGRDPSAGANDEILGMLDLFTTPYYLYFKVGTTYVSYGPVLSATLSLGFVSLAAVFVVRQRDRKRAVCPFCASRIPHESTHCAYCGSGVGPAEL